MGLIDQIVTWILGLIFKRPPGPTQEAQAAKAEGEAQVQAAGAEQALAAEKAVAQAESDAPRDQDAVVVQLRQGKF